MAKKKEKKPRVDSRPDDSELPEEEALPEARLHREPMRLDAALVVCAGGWLVPGVSHIVLGRWGRGLTFTASVITMFSLGLLMQGHLYDMTPEQPLHIFAFIADAGSGLAYVVAQQLGLGEGVLSNPNYDYGSTYLWVSGLLNYLIVLDAFDISQGRKP